jgi:transcriptional regulator with XRE-family HTH domain
MKEIHVPSSSRPEMVVNNSRDLGAAIRTARKDASLRVVDAAQLASVAVQTLVDIEAGRPGVSIGKIMQVADALGICFFAVPAKERQLIRNIIANATSSVSGKQT